MEKHNSVLVTRKFEVTMTEGLTTDWALWESYARALIGAIKRCDGGVFITMATEMEFFNTAA